VVARAARDDAHGLGLREHGLRGRPERSLEQLAAGNALFERLRHGARLLVDFLEHVVGELALLGGVGRQLAQLGGTLHGVAFAVEYPHAVAADLADVAFLEEDEVARHRQQCRDVGGDEVLVLAEPDHHRAALAGDHDAVGLVLRDHRERIGTLEFGNRGAHGLEQVARHFQVMVDPVGDDLGVGFRGKLVALALRFFAQLFVILDDAVVDDRDAVLGDVRVRIPLARHAVRGPAGVRDPETAVGRVCVECILQLADLAHRAQALDVVRAVQHGDAGRVVPAILEASQALDQDGDDVTVGDGSNDSAHAAFLAMRGGEANRIISRIKDLAHASEVGRSVGWGILVQARRRRPRPASHWQLGRSAKGRLR